MATREDYYKLIGQMAEIKSKMASLLASQRPQDVSAREILANQLTDLERELEGQLIARSPMPLDDGLSAALGIGAAAAAGIGQVPVPISIPSYDDAIVSERLYAVAELYYCYQMERLGLFRAVNKLKELFRAGKLRLASGQGAFELYRFDRKEVLRYTFQERMQAYSRVFGYTDHAPPRGAKPNTPFHALLSHFNLQIAQLFRDKSIAETFRPGAGATDPGFGSIASARRAGLDLRSNLKRASYGDVNVLTIELLQVIGSAFEILSAPDIRSQFGAGDGYETLEEVLERYLNERPVVSQRTRLAETGKPILQWLGQSHILAQGRTAFEALVQNIAELCEEWLVSAQSLTAARERAPDGRRGSNIVAFPSSRRKRA